VEIRPTAAADLPAQFAVFREAIGELFRRHRFAPPDPPYEVFEAQQSHLLAHDGDRCFVVLDRGRVVGYSAALARGETWHLASLFVHPGQQARGLGRALLEQSWGGPYARRLTLTDSIQPVSNGLYGRAGLIPATPVLSLAGRAPAASGAVPLRAAAPDPTTLARLDRDAYGFDRAVDHAYWSTHASCTVWLSAAGAVAYAYTWPEGRIGPLAARDAESAADALRAELGRADGRPRHLLVPGSSAALAGAALAAGLRIVGPPGLLLLSRGVAPPAGLALSSFTLL